MKVTILTMKVQGHTYISLVSGCITPDQKRNMELCDPPIKIQGEYEVRSLEQDQTLLWWDL
jgi:hypothetical protein